VFGFQSHGFNHRYSPYDLPQEGIFGQLKKCSPATLCAMAAWAGPDGLSICAEDAGFTLKDPAKIGHALHQSRN